MASIKSDLISEYYEAQNRKLHRHPRGFGASGHRWVDKGDVPAIIKKYKVRSLLDYGCGRGTLWKALVEKRPRLAAHILYVGYDPCFSGKEKIPKEKYDLVTCTDVLEHIEPMYLDNVLKHVFSLASKVIFFNISLVVANKNLPDGRNAHLIIKPCKWWLKKLKGIAPDWRFKWEIARFCKYSDIPKDLNVECVKC
jgi:2-polyprenyl-3-methyl-5-hydroxy-6-metoxy-1,4-benzoquinol methylase